ncbi:hypothetical protein ANO11243_039660 [Dothideomycetidae sp. 11243]|nr:hypothetical protein ANO11243_039660 [fungal sp. No.11243]
MDAVEEDEIAVKAQRAAPGSGPWPTPGPRVYACSRATGDSAPGILPPTQRSIRPRGSWSQVRRPRARLPGTLSIKFPFRHCGGYSQMRDRVSALGLSLGGCNARPKQWSARLSCGRN